MEDVSAGRDGKYGLPKIDCAAADSGAVELNDLIFRRLSLPPEDDSAAVDYDRGTVGLDDLIFRQLSFPLEEFAAGWDAAMAAGGAVKLDDMIFRLTNLPPDYISGSATFSSDGKCGGSAESSSSSGGWQTDIAER